MFIGTYYHTLEEKGRVSFPKKFREFSAEWVITRGLDGGLFVVPQTQFAVEMQRLSALSFTKKANRDLIRLMANQAEACRLDEMGRFLIPEALRATAQLTKQVVIIGSYHYVEVWDQALYHEYLDQAVSRAEDIAEQVTLPVIGHQQEKVSHA